MLLAAFLALLSFCAPLHAAGVSSGTIRLALIEDTPNQLDLTLPGPLKAVFAAGTSGQLESVRTLPCYYAADYFRFRIPRAQVETGTATAVALESDSELVVVWPPIPELVAEIKTLAAQPEAYNGRWSVALTSRAAVITQFQDPEGDALVTVAPSETSEEPAVWHNSVAVVHQARWKGRPVFAVAIGRVYGGLGRLAYALAQADKDGKHVGVARGGTMGGPTSELSGKALAEALERAGLRYTAVGSSELRSYKELLEYRAAHPDGIQYLSANLVYSSATSVSFFPSRAIVRAGGLRVALVGITPASSAKYLPAAGLGNLTVADPLDALQGRLEELRKDADVLVLLVDVYEDQERLRRARGVDLIVGEDRGWPSWAPLGESTLTRRDRTVYEHPIWTVRTRGSLLTLVDADVATRDGKADWRLRERQVVLDDSIPNAAGYGEFDPSTYGIAFSTEAPLVPAARDIYAGSPDAVGRRLGEEDVWRLNATMLSHETKSEAALLRVWPLAVTVDEGAPEPVVRKWLSTDERVVFAQVPGWRLRQLIVDSQEQERRLARGLGVGPISRFTYGGVDGDRIHGAPIEDQSLYRVATTRVLADALGLNDREPDPEPQPLDELVLSAMRKRKEGAGQWREWVEGKPIEQTSVWKINFRDVGLNVQNTKVVRDDAFNSVPNSRVQGFDELLIGGDLRVDADWLDAPLKWSNTLEMEYARSRLHPRGQPTVTNTTANRITFLTTGTRRVGAVHNKWLGSSWGPSIGLQYDGQFEASPGLRRRNIYSAFPGVQFYEGTFIKSMELSGNIRRDMSRDPPNTQYGLHTRWLFAKSFASSPATLAGELFTNYFFNTSDDRVQDLRVEGDFNMKVRFPVRAHLTVAPFVDFYYFALKTQPLWGYSAMTGVQIGFSRLWKPQYEKF